MRFDGITFFKKEYPSRQIGRGRVKLNFEHFDRHVTYAYFSIWNYKSIINGKAFAVWGAKTELHNAMRAM